MVAYRYRAMTAGGSVVQGTLEAADEAAVLRHIRELGQFPVSARLAGTGGLAEFLARLRPGARASLKGLSLATQELTTLLQAGLELDRALGFLGGLADLGAWAPHFRAARNKVRDGESFADALGAERAFPNFYVSMVRAGEAGGTLAATLGKLGDYLGKTIAMREAIASALVYPVILVVTAGFSITFILTFVLPQFEPLFQEAGKTLPLAARIVMGAGHFVRAFWWLILLAAAGAGYWLRRALRDPEFRLSLDGRLLRLPLLGELFAAIDIERFSRTMGTLLANGVAVPAALGLAKDVCANSVIAKALRETAQSLREGEGLGDRLARTGVIPARAIDLIRVGEQSGKLDEMLLRQADLDEQRIRHTVDRLLAFLVPGLTVFLGFVIGGLIAAMMTAILGLNDLALQ